MLCKENYADYKWLFMWEVHLTSGPSVSYFSSENLEKLVTKGPSTLNISMVQVVRCKSRITEKVVQGFRKIGGNCSSATKLLV